jgi:hypothetical protein
MMLTQTTLCGRIAALAIAVSYLVGIVMMLTVFNLGELSPPEKLAAVLAQRTAYQLWYLQIWLLSAIGLLVLALALSSTFKDNGGLLVPLTTAFGVIWSGVLFASGMIALRSLDIVAALHTSDAAAALALWRANNVVIDGLGGGIELLGGVWLLLLSVLSWQQKHFPRWFDSLGIVIGCAGVLTVWPSLNALTMVFGLGQIFWFVALAAIWRESH